MSSRAILLLQNLSPTTADHIHAVLNAYSKRFKFTTAIMLLLKTLPIHQLMNKLLPIVFILHKSSPINFSQTKQTFLERFTSMFGTSS